MGLRRVVRAGSASVVISTLSVALKFSATQTQYGLSHGLGNTPVPEAPRKFPGCHQSNTPAPDRRLGWRKEPHTGVRTESGISDAGRPAGTTRRLGTLRDASRLLYRILLPPQHRRIDGSMGGEESVGTVHPPAARSVLPDASALRGCFIDNSASGRCRSSVT